MPCWANSCASVSFTPGAPLLGNSAKIWLSVDWLAGWLAGRLAARSGVPRAQDPGVVDAEGTAVDAGVAGDQRQRVVLAQEQPGRQREPGVDGQGGGHGRDDPADEHAGQRADGEGDQGPGGERDPVRGEHRRREYAQVLLRQERLEEPDEHLAERSG